MVYVLWLYIAVILQWSNFLFFEDGGVELVTWTLTVVLTHVSSWRYITRFFFTYQITRTKLIAIFTATEATVSVYIIVQHLDPHVKNRKWSSQFGLISPSLRLCLFHWNKYHFRWNGTSLSHCFMFRNWRNRMGL